MQRLRRNRPNDDQPLAGDDAILIVGLGNPGRRYQRTRHNIGFMVVDRLARDLPAGTARSRMQAELYETRLGERRVILAKPQTFMNASGESVGQLVRWYRIKRPNLLIVYDDLNLPFGTLRLRPGGSDGGHNGLTSIIQHLGTEQVPRLRVGIGRPVRGSTVPYVLSEFFQDERPLLPGVIDRAAAAVHDWMTLGIDAAMNLHNRKPDAETTQPKQANPTG